MTSTMDKIMQAMAAAVSEIGGGSGNSSTETGAKLLAFIRHGGGNDGVSGGSVSPARGSPGGSACPTSSKGNGSILGMTHAGGESKISYDRDFLFSCADAPICKEMPKGLISKLEEFPQMKRKIRSLSGGFMNYNNTPDHFRFFEHQPSIVDSLPLRPTAQIFTWDPNMGQWVPRARPQEA